MAEISVSLNPIFFSHLKRIVDTVSRSLWRRPAVALRMVDEADTDLESAWKSGLLLSLREDLESLTTLLLELGAGATHLELKDIDAERLLRASSALRLRLRESCFREIPEEALETGALEFQSLSLEDQRVYGVYLFLANLQEQLVAELDPDAGDWGE